MKLTRLFAAGSLAVSLAIAQPPYTVIDLGPAGNPFSQATWINDFGLTTGLDTAPDGASHAVLWLDKLLLDISQPGLGGKNSAALAVNQFGVVAGEAETARRDPDNENFCGYGTGLQCLAFVWQFGRMTPLRAVGGVNSGFGAINDLGEVAGYAETGHRDPACAGTVAVNGTGPQLFDFEAVIWGPWPGQVRALKPLPGDTVGMAFGINDYGQAVGTSGTCVNTVVPGFALGPHAVMWDTDGSVRNLGSLGGTVNTSILAVGTVAFAINNRGQITGQSVLAGNTAFHPFIWTKETGMQDLGLLPGDFVGAGLGMNNRGQVVGASVSAPGPAGGNPRAFLWQNGVISDLNAMIQMNPPLYLLNAFAINDDGEIVGFGVTSEGEPHGFLAVPNHGNISVESGAEGLPSSPRAIPDELRRLLLQHLRFGGLGGLPNR